MWKICNLEERVSRGVGGHVVRAEAAYEVGNGDDVAGLDAVRLSLRRLRQPGRNIGLQSGATTGPSHAYQHVAVLRRRRRVRRLDAQVARQRSAAPAPGESLPWSFQTLHGEVAEVRLQQLAQAVAELQVEVSLSHNKQASVTTFTFIIVF